jgi:hypothetical protein
MPSGCFTDQRFDFSICVAMKADAFCKRAGLDETRTTFSVVAFSIASSALLRPNIAKLIASRKISSRWLMRSGEYAPAIPCSGTLVEIFVPAVT